MLGSGVAVRNETRHVVKIGSFRMVSSPEGDLTGPLVGVWRPEILGTQYAAAGRNIYSMRESGTTISRDGNVDCTTAIRPPSLR